SNEAVNFKDVVELPLRDFATKLVDVWAGVLGVLTPGLTINGKLARRYRTLFGNATLNHLPDRPEFVFDATSLQSGDLWRFSKDVEGDWRVGSHAKPDVELAAVVAASSAFPPFLSPARFSFPAGTLTKGHDSKVGK